VLVPSSPGALSAIGVITADVVKDQTRTVMLDATDGAAAKLERIFRAMERDGEQILRAEGFARPHQRHERSLALRYRGQSFEITIKQTGKRLREAFHQAHEARYGYAQRKNPVEIVSARLRSIGIVPEIRIRRSARRAMLHAAAPHNFAITYFGRQKVRVAVYQRQDLKPGSRLRVPSIVTEYSATTLIPKETSAHLDKTANIIIELQASVRSS